jgi:hypothetical protein
MTIQDRINSVANELNKHIDNEMLSYLVAESAGYYWEGIQADDFGLQVFDTEYIVFGGVNRIVWSPANGFRPDRSYCTARFLKRYESIGPLPGLNKFKRDQG